MIESFINMTLMVSVTSDRKDKVFLAFFEDSLVGKMKKTTSKTTNKTFELLLSFHLKFWVKSLQQSF